MNFYKTTLTIMAIVLIICLAMIGTTMASTEAVKYPPIMSECPDYYRKESTGCVSQIDDITAENTVDLIGKDNTAISGVSCTDVNFGDKTLFTRNGNSGMGPESAICEKKKWAIGCGVNWDGITNNDNICYA